MAKQSFTTPVLGALAWEGHGWWFTFPLRGGRGRGTLMTESASERPSDEFLDAVRQYVRWFQRNDTKLRALIARKMFKMWRANWYEPEFDRTRTPLGFQRKLNLAGINFYWDEPWVSVIYNDGNLFGGHGIELATDFRGKIDGDPMMFG